MALSESWSSDMSGVLWGPPWHGSPNITNTVNSHWWSRHCSAAGNYTICLNINLTFAFNSRNCWHQHTEGNFQQTVHIFPDNFVLYVGTYLAKQVILWGSTVSCLVLADALVLRIILWQKIHTNSTVMELKCLSEYFLIQVWIYIVWGRNYVNLPWGLFHSVLIPLLTLSVI